MAGKSSEPLTFSKWLAKPEVGTALTILSGLTFLFVCMILPLVGKAGVQTTHAVKNGVTFGLILGLTIALCGLAIKSKLDRSKIDGSPFPIFSAIIGGLCLILLFCLVFGLLEK